MKKQRSFVQFPKCFHGRGRYEKYIATVGEDPERLEVMDVKKTLSQPEQADRTESSRRKKSLQSKGGGPADFATELARCQEADSQQSPKAVAEQERAERVQALKKKVSEGMYRTDLHEVARNLLFNDNSEPLL